MGDDKNNQIIINVLIKLKTQDSGGDSSFTQSRSCYRYEPSANEWIFHSDLPLQRLNFIMGSLPDGRLLPPERYEVTPPAIVGYRETVLLWNETGREWEDYK